MSPSIAGRAPFRGVLAGCALALLGAWAPVAPAGAADRPASHIVQLRAGTSAVEGRAAVAAAGGRVTASVPIIRGLAVRLPHRAAAVLRRDGRIAAVTANVRVTPRMDGLEASGLATAYPDAVQAPQVWSAWTGRGVGVAVVDTGIAGRVADFADARGRSRVIASAVTNPAATSADDRFGHGTHVAGIVAGDGRRRDPRDPVAGRYVGIAPDANLISVKVSDDAGNASVLDVINGLQFVVDHKDALNIRVVNLSLQSAVPASYRTDPLDAAVEAAWFSGIVVVAAGGNRGDAPDAVGYAPGNDPFAISVGAMDDRGTKARGDDLHAAWSSTGRTQDGFAKPDILAPGSAIVSVLAPGSAYATACPDCVVGKDYIRAGGSSMAAPVVAGVVALMLEANPRLTPDQVKGTLLARARDISGPLDVVSAKAADAARSPSPPANAGIAPNDLVTAATGTIDYTRASWSRASWSAAPAELAAGWARASWSCACAATGGGETEPSRASWSRASWSTRWGL